MPARPGVSLVAVATVFAAALLGVGLANWRAVRAASSTLVRGQADLMHDQLRVALGRDIPTEQELADLVAGYSEQRLDYVALADREGNLLVESGHSAWPDGLDPRGTGVNLDRDGDRVRARYRRGLPPRLARRFGVPTATLLVFEFEPTSVNELERRARWGVAVSAIFGLFAIGLSLSYTRQRSRADVSQRKEEQSRRLAALGQMSAVLAHELRNPLASLKGHAQLLERTLDGAQRDKAALVVSEAVRLERLSGDLLTFVRTGVLHKAPTDLAALVRTFGATAPDALTIDIDGERIRQVVANLVDNARAAGQPVEVALTATNDSAIITVRDHGAGIEDPARLFEPFFTTKTHGTGLGLAIARQIVELHGGTIEAANAQPGARFTVTLPRSS